MKQARGLGMVVGLASLFLSQSCAGPQMRREPDRSFPLPANQVGARIVSILEEPPLEYEIVSWGKGKIRAKKEYPGDPYGLPLLKKHMNERALVTVRLEPNPQASDSTNLFVDVIIEETESFNTGWVPKEAPEKREEILSTLIQRLDEEM